ncbi:unnamed protein product [Protopolystoma xenopodis]|uniref:Uncharacterized protein n=1 Tax=Protopolystoma xenopodis TaxID=117903 RepID=A0A3S4ZTG6_9PLAT|nr:unnamed protein product [Protopolystoma xenopodis]
MAIFDSRSVRTESDPVSKWAVRTKSSRFQTQPEGQTDCGANQVLGTDWTADSVRPVPVGQRKIVAIPAGHWVGRFAGGQSAELGFEKCEECAMPSQKTWTLKWDSEREEEHEAK